MRNLITVLAIVFCTTCFSQKLSISKGSYKTESVIKIEFPIDYTLRFFKNDKLIKKEKFKGERLYKIENFEKWILFFIKSFLEINGSASAFLYRLIT